MKKTSCIGLGLASLVATGPSVHGYEYEPGLDNYPTVDLIAFGPGKTISCPDFIRSRETPGNDCVFQGIVTEIDTKNSRIRVSGTQTSFGLGEDLKEADLALLQVSLSEETPLRLHFQNWGGRFYIRGVNLK